MKRLVLIGAGHAHAQVLLDLASTGNSGVDVVVVSPTPLALYSGMVPGWLAGHYDWDQCCIDFAHLCRLAGAALKTDMATGIDPARSRVQLASGEQIGYDLLSLDIGSTATPPAGDHVEVLPMRPLDQLNKRWSALRETVRSLPAEASYRVLMIGGGAAGTESVLAAQRQLAQWAPLVRFEFALATEGNALLPGLASGAGKRITTHLSERAIRCVYDFTAERVEGDRVISRDGRTLATDALLWAAGAKAHAWPAGSGLALDAAGFIQVDQTLRSVSHAHIFAAGDCASFATPLAKAGVFAVRMGPVLAHNLRTALRGMALKAYIPQRRYLVLIGTGDENAVAAWGPLSWQGKWVWRWKQRIDKRFLEKYNDQQLEVNRRPHA